MNTAPQSRISRLHAVKCIAAGLFFFLLAALQMQAQAGLQPAPARMNWWTCFGPGAGTLVPGAEPFYGNRTFFGAEASLNAEYKQIVYTLRGYGMGNLSNDFFADNTSSLTSVELMIGKRYYAKTGSVILSAGISKGQLSITTADTGVQTGGWFFSQEIYSHYAGSFIGVPLSVRYLSRGKHCGIEFGGYCNVHKYTNMGLSLCMSLGKRT